MNDIEYLEEGKTYSFDITPTAIPNPNYRVFLESDIKYIKVLEQRVGNPYNPESLRHQRRYALVQRLNSRFEPIGKPTPLLNFMGLRNLQMLTNENENEMPSRNIPKLNSMGLPTASALTLTNIKDGNTMVNFPRTKDKTEYNFGEYYSNSAYKAIPVPKLNPQTRGPINAKSLKRYKAHLVPLTNIEKINTTLFNGGKGKGKTKKNRNSRRLSMK